MWLYVSLLAVHILLSMGLFIFILILCKVKRKKLPTAMIVFIVAVLAALANCSMRTLRGGPWDSWGAMDDVLQDKWHGIKSIATVQKNHSADGKSMIRFDGYTAELFLDQHYAVGNTIPVMYLKQAPAATVMQNSRTLGNFDLLTLRGRNLGKKDVDTWHFFEIFVLDVIFVYLAPLCLVLLFILTAGRMRKFWRNEITLNPEYYSPGEIKKGNEAPIIKEFTRKNSLRVFGTDRYDRSLYHIKSQKILWLWETHDRDPFGGYEGRELRGREEIERPVDLDEKTGKVRLFCQGLKGPEEVIRWDIQEITPNQLIKITFLKKTSLHKQGIRLAVTDGHLEINGRRSQAMVLWWDTAPMEVVCRCVADDGLLSIYNVYDKGNGRRSLGYTAGMIVEEQDGRIVYRCNDSGYDTNFDKLVFSLEKQNSEE